MGMSYYKLDKDMNMTNERFEKLSDIPLSKWDVLSVLSLAGPRYSKTPFVPNLKGLVGDRVAYMADDKSCVVMVNVPPPVEI